MIAYLFTNCINVLKKKPLILWGLSLLSMLLYSLIMVFGIIPLITIPLVLVLFAGMSMVYLAGLKGEEVSADQLFLGFKDFIRIAGGMAWAFLWVLLWALIPVVGVIFAIIKTYSYRYVPYILMTQPEVSATKALKLSIEQTKGRRATMFACDLIVYAAVTLSLGLLLSLSFIPFIGVLFMILYFVAALAVTAFFPVFVGLLQASYYELMPKYVAPIVTKTVGVTPGFKFCSDCGTRLPVDAKFCSGCGFKFDVKPEAEKKPEAEEKQPEVVAASAPKSSASAPKTTKAKAKETNTENKV